MKRIVLHIGTHKTGSTSIQRFLLDHANYLSELGIALYRGQFHETNHRELDLASMRYERDSFARLGNSRDIDCGEEFTRLIVKIVHDYLNACPEPQVIFTSEGLSWIRFDDEIERLKSILDIGRNEATVVVYLRNKEDYLKSYTRQLYKNAERSPSDDFNSVLYVEQGTWLTDYDTLIAKYEKGFGANNVVVIDYDEEMQKHGNVIPAFLRVLGIDPTTEFDLSSYFLNTTDPTVERKPYRGVKRWLKHVSNVWRARSSRPAA